MKKKKTGHLGKRVASAALTAENADFVRFDEGLDYHKCIHGQRQR